MTEAIRTKEEAIQLMKREIENYKSVELGLGEVGSAKWNSNDLSLDEAKAAGYLSALSWAYGITPDDLKGGCVKC